MGALLVSALKIFLLKLAAHHWPPADVYKSLLLMAAVASVLEPRTVAYKLSLRHVRVHQDHMRQVRVGFGLDMDRAPPLGGPAILDWH